MNLFNFVYEHSIENRHNVVDSAKVDVVRSKINIHQRFIVLTHSISINITN